MMGLLDSWRDTRAAILGNYGYSQPDAWQNPGYGQTYTPGPWTANDEVTSATQAAGTPHAPRQQVPVLPEGSAQDDTPPSTRSPANNFGWMGPMARMGAGLLGAALPGGGLLGLGVAGGQQAAANAALGTYGQQFSPSYFSHLTGNVFGLDPFYDKVAEIMDSKSIGGRTSTLHGAPVFDYTHQYANPGLGDTEYDPSPEMQAVAAQQAAAVHSSPYSGLDIDMSGTSDDPDGFGGAHNEADPGEMSDDW